MSDNVHTMSDVRSQDYCVLEDLPMSPQAVKGDKDDEGANRVLAP